VRKYPERHYLIVRDITEAEIVCGFIEGRVDAATLMSTFSKAVSPGFDAERHLQRIGVANQTTMLARESLAIADAVGASIARARGEEARATSFGASIRSAARRKSDRTPSRSYSYGRRRHGGDRRIQLEQHHLACALCADRVPTYHIETSSAIDPVAGSIHFRPAMIKHSEADAVDWIPTGPVRVGVTAGASTRTTKSATSSRACWRHEDWLRTSNVQPQTTGPVSFVRYIALGDSMSIDLYPALDAGEVDVAVALERVTTAGRVGALGAASLFYKNSEERWPDDVGNDLSSLFPGIELTNLASDGATIGEVFGEQLPQLEDSSDRLLITLTAGGNDLLSALGNRPRGSCWRGSRQTSPKRMTSSSICSAGGSRMQRSF
jgi:lysophospholipase L1-like esterase